MWTRRHFVLAAIRGAIAVLHSDWMPGGPAHGAQMFDSPIVVKAHCNTCRGEKNQNLIASQKQRHDELNEHGDLEYWETTLYEMLQCRGCDNVTLRSTFCVCDNTNSELVSYFPPAVTRNAPDWFDLSFRIRHPDLSSLFGEVYAALHAGSNRLAMMGARTVIDMVILDQIGDVGSFKEKLTKMEAEGYLSRKNREFVWQATDAGSASAHRGYRPVDADVNRVMDIVENFVQAVYVLPRAADTLQKNTPERAPRKTPRKTETSDRGHTPSAQ